MQEIIGLITAVSHVTNITKSFVQAHNEAQRSSLQIELNGAMLELQGKLGALQVNYQALVESNDSLKKQLATFQRWEQERSRYQLVKRGAGTFIYGLKTDHANEEPAHWLCPNCFESGRKSILQWLSAVFYKCPACDKQFQNVGDACFVGAP
jgi:competence protein ComGF